MGQKTPLEKVVRERVAKNARDLRHSARLTVKAAAALAGIHWRHWQKIEAAQLSITVDTLAKMAGALNVDPAVLLGEPKELPKGSPPQAPPPA